MSATNGSLRSRSRLLGLSLVVIIALTAVFASAAGARTFKPERTTLALGDSLAFGYSAQDFNEHLTLTNPEPATAFENGYANQYLKLQHPTSNKIQLENLGCPGETTNSLIGNGPLAAGLGETAEEQEAPCAYRNVEAEKAGYPTGTHFPLHHEYGENAYHQQQSQLEAALESLVVNKISGTPVETITLNIGANDELHEIGKCEAEVKAEIVPTEGKYFSKYGGEAEGIKGAEAAGEAAFLGHEAEVAFGKGEIEKGLTYKKLAEEAGARAVADFEKSGEEGVEGCIAYHFEGLVTHILTNIGRTLYVLRNAEVFTGYPGTDYLGKIVVQGGYDPYGRVYATETEVLAAKAVGPQFSTAHLHELLKGTNGLAAVINAHEKELVEGTFGACFAGVQGGAPGAPHTAFNPGIGHEEGESGSLQKFTNMNNQTSTSTPFGPKADGPDIHPTAAGYLDLARVMKLDCGI